MLLYTVSETVRYNRRTYNNNRMNNETLDTQQQTTVKECITITRVLNMRAHGIIRRAVPVLLVILSVIAGAFAQYSSSVYIANRGRISVSSIAYQSELRGVLIKQNYVPPDPTTICDTLVQYGINAIYYQINPFYYTGLDLSRFGAMIDAIKVKQNQGYDLDFHVLMTVGFGTGTDYTTQNNEQYWPYGFTGYQQVWCTYDNTGQLTRYPAYRGTEAKDRIKEVIQKMLTLYPDIVDINLDYIRYQTDNGINWMIPYDNASKSDFLTWLTANGKIFTGTWSDYFYSNGSKWTDFAQWRATTVNRIVTDITAWAREIEPSIRVTADVFCPWIGTWYPDTLIEEIGQDTAYWISQGYLNSVDPMNYYQTLADMQYRVNKEKQYWLGADQHPTGKGAIPLVPFITTGGSGTGGVVPIDVFIQQINFLRDSGCNGFILYMYDGPGFSTGWNPTVPYLAAIRDNTTKGAFPTFTQNTPSAVGNIISWQTSLPTLGSVEYSTSPLFVATPYTRRVSTVDVDYSAGTVITNPNATTQHTFTLPISTPFYYRVIDNDSNIELASSVHLATG
jgi:hypothetical protein